MAEIRARSRKAAVAIVPYSTPEEMRQARELTRRFQERGVPSFPSIDRGAQALKNALDYYLFKRGDGA
jgi:acyl-CoA synthetase (NDP forming)